MKASQNGSRVPKRITIDGNEAVASVAYRTNEVIAIYPITPASAMGELSDEWAAQGKPNLWGSVPDVVEMQSEAGAAGAVHGALQTGALTTTFTASQGLLLMLPNLYKIAGELTAFCMHVASRSIATHALSIFGDHSDVMACRGSGFALLASASVQEAHDFACIAQAATLRARVPFLHFFDGFRTSHEIKGIDALSDADLRAMIDPETIEAHRARALDPNHPFIRGTAQNPDAFFQAREACNPYYDACPRIVQEVMDRFAAHVGRHYHLFDYHGHPEADRVLVLMGSGAETVHATVDALNARGDRVGVVRVHLYRPFSIEAFIEALPSSVRRIAVLDRTKEPGAPGEPLYLDVVNAIHGSDEGEKHFEERPSIIGGRYGLSSKEFTPAMVKAIFDHLKDTRPRRRFTIGIIDDVTGLSIPYDSSFGIEKPETIRALFFGLGSDGTVGSNKNTIKIIGEETGRHAQGYFVYDSKKSGAMTVSHLRFGPEPIRAPYLIAQAGFVACHQPVFLERIDVLQYAAPGAVFLLNTPHPPEHIWDRLPLEVQEAIIEKKLTFYVIDAFGVARQTGMGRHISTIMQTCFFELSGVLPHEEAIDRIKAAIEKTFGKKGREVVKRNNAAVDLALAHLKKVDYPSHPTTERRRPPIVPPEAPERVQKLTAVMMAGQGDLLPVSAFPVDGTWPSGTTQWERRNIALEIPIWDAKVCIQCNKCALVCPHAAIRASVFEDAHLERAPKGFPTVPYKAAEFKGLNYTIQVAPEDCTGCGLCVAVCPAKDRSNPRHKAIDMLPHDAHVEREKANFAFFRTLPEPDRTRVKHDVKGSQLLQPLFEFSGACAGCGETPYIKLVTQLFGDRLVIANATGCSSIYGGNLPTTPYTVNADGRGPAWSNSLFEDNAEFGFGMRLAIDQQKRMARDLLIRLAPAIGDELTSRLLEECGRSEDAIRQRREEIRELRKRLKSISDPDARALESIADNLVRKSVWLIGGDGWAYDIGYGGLDHVLASDRDINVLVLDTEVYSNTGGQQSKATPLGAAAKFAAGGKASDKKDLGLLAMTYGHVYVAQIAFGAKDAQTLHAIREAEAYPGPSLVIAYSHCIAHGYDLVHGASQQKLAVDSGIWPLYRFDPRRSREGESPLHLDSGPPRVPVHTYMLNETRFRMVEKRDPKRFKMLMERAADHARRRASIYQQLAALRIPTDDAGSPADGQ